MISLYFCGMAEEAELLAHLNRLKRQTSDNKPPD